MLEWYYLVIELVERNRQTYIRTYSWKVFWAKKEVKGIHFRLENHWTNTVDAQMNMRPKDGQIICPNRLCNLCCGSHVRFFMKMGACYT